MKLKSFSRLIVSCLVFFHTFQSLNCQKKSDCLVTGSSGATEEENRISPIEIIQESVSGNNVIVDYGKTENLYFETKGASLKSISKFSRQTQVVASIDSNEAILGAREQNVQIQPTKTYYARDSLGTLHSSQISLDTARKKAGYKPTSLYISIINPPIIPLRRGMIFDATFSWFDSKGTKFPLEGATVILENSIQNLSTYTNSSGLAEFNLSSRSEISKDDVPSKIWETIKEENYSLKLRLQNNYVNVKDSSGSTYEIEIDKSQVQGTGTENREVSIGFQPHDSQGNESDFGEATQIFQAYYYYSNHARDLIDSHQLKMCSVVFPSAKLKRTFEYFDADSRIEIGNGPTNNASINSFESWDALGHEYGHHIENCMKFRNLKLTYSHWAWKDDCAILYSGVSADGEFITYDDTYGKSDASKDKGLQLAWNESWPTFWATMAQASFPEAIRNEDYLSVGDSRYYAGNFTLDSKGKPKFQDYDPHDKDGNTDYGHGIDGGDGCELAIIRFLYQLWDSDNTDLDIFTISEKDLWNTLMAAMGEKKVIYFFQYLEYLMQDYGSGEITALAQKFRLVPYFIGFKDKKILQWSMGSYNTELEDSRTNYNQCTIYVFKNSTDSWPMMLNNDKPFSADELGYKARKSYALCSTELEQLKSYGTFYLCFEISYIKEDGSVIGPFRTGLIKETL